MKADCILVPSWAEEQHFQKGRGKQKYSQIFYGRVIIAILDSVCLRLIMCYLFFCLGLFSPFLFQENSLTQLQINFIFFLKDFYGKNT